MGWFSDLFGDDKEDSEVSQQYQDMSRYYSGIHQPTADELKLILERMVKTGQITPEMAQTMYQEQSGMNDISTDPALYEAQLKSLSSLQDIGENNGLTAMDRAQLNTIRNEEGVRMRGNADAITNQMAARGISGSGQELAQRMANQQSTADREANRGISVAALAQQRALDAIAKSGTQAGSMREQSFNEEAQKAKAQDAINQYNTQIKQATELSNVAARNAAQEKNLNRDYAIQEYNLGQSNKERVNQAQVPQTQFTNAMNVASGKSGIGTNYAKSLDSQNQNTAEYVGALGSAFANSKTGQNVIGGVTDWFSGWLSDKNLKKDKEELSTEEVSDLLDNLTGYSYRYKGSNIPGVGVMAQDLENTPLEENVIDTPKGKMVKGNPEMMSAMLAALANINNRVNDLEKK